MRGGCIVKSIWTMNLCKKVSQTWDNKKSIMNVMLLTNVTTFRHPISSKTLILEISLLSLALCYHSVVELLKQWYATREYEWLQGRQQRLIRVYLCSTLWHRILQLQVELLARVFPVNDEEWYIEVLLYLNLK